MVAVNPAKTHEAMHRGECTLRARGATLEALVHTRLLEGEVLEARLSITSEEFCEVEPLRRWLELPRVSRRVWHKRARP